MGLLCLALRRTISSLMMPACTGLPPGELMSSTSACEPSSSSALRMAATTNSALASAPAAISPLMSTTAVCGLLLVAVFMSRDITAQARKTKKASHPKRVKVRQRRAARCSARVAKASFSSTSRSQPGALAGGEFAPESVAARAHRSGAAGCFGSNPLEGGCWGSVMSELNGLEVLCSMPAHPAALSPGAGASRATRARCGPRSGAARGQRWCGRGRRRPRPRWGNRR